MASEKFPIVGIGASAGGVEALEGFFRGLPDLPGLGLVIVTHLSPERESHLHEIVKRFTGLPVHVAENGIEVMPNNVYVLPSDAILTIQQRRLLLAGHNSQRPRKPIDIFFSALAADVGELAAGVVLSGGDADGTLGIKAIKEQGGLTLAQVSDGFGPQHPSMPETAISSGLVDFGVPVEEMGARLVEFARGGAVLDLVTGDGSGDGNASREKLDEIYAILRSQIGHDFSGYKTKTFQRRLQRRMHVTQFGDIDAYIDLLRREPQEVQALFRDLLINVTNFFRDADAFEALAIEVIPKMLEGRGADDIVRVWVPGCATGEEVYSIAILIREHIDKLTAVPRIQIFATDIDEQALSVARAARYPELLLESVSPERRKRFFIADGGSFVVSKDVREFCIFSPHSVIRDPPFSRIDLVSCRNLLIYFGADIQNQVIPIFHYALRPDGHLFLGTAENVTQFDELFVPVDKRHRIFRRRSDMSPSIRLPSILTAMRPGRSPDATRRRPPLGGVALRDTVREQVLERFSPPHVVVTADGEVVYYSGRTGKYLEAAEGAPSRHLLAMARKSLRLDLRSMLTEAIESGRTATREGVAVESEEGRVQVVNLVVDRLHDADEREPLFVVMFNDQGPLLSREEALERATTRHGDAVHAELELRETRDRLQTMIEEYETALEELKSSNEELVSVNEEMQSTNEELEASKEELQSVNEELHTVNGELNAKVEALDLANSDLQNLFDSTDVATVFLDENLVIRSFTPAVRKVFNILPSDRGRPITDLSSRLNLDSFADDIKKVFGGSGPVERQVDDDTNAAHYLVRLAPYRDAGEKIEGVVVTFIDVTGLTKSEAQQRLLIAELQHRTRNLLTVVQSIAQQTLGKDAKRDAFYTRLAALGRVQSLVSGAMDDRVDLEKIVRMELQAVGAPEAKVSISGPPTLLDFHLIQTFGLALHELATNATKHGALKAGDGRLDVRWSVVEAATPRLILDWNESGVAEMPKTIGSGFGRKLIEKALEFTLGANTKLTFGRDGIACHIEVPLPSRPGFAGPPA